MCIHHWFLDSVVAGKQHGVCLKCGQQRDFPVYGQSSYNRSLDEGKLKQEEFYAVESAYSIIENPGMKRWDV